MKSLPKPSLMYCISLVCSALLGSTGIATHAAERPNIILVMADDLGWGDVSYTNVSLIAAEGGGNAWCQTPNLDAMAASGLRFDRFYSAAAVCSPTRASCLTGRNPLRVGVPWANRGHLSHDDGGPNAEVPLSVVLSNAGYRTGHFGKWHLGILTTLTNDGNRGGPGADPELYSAPWHFQYDASFTNESSIPTYHPYRRTNNTLALPTSFSDPNFYGTRFWKIPATWNYNSGEGDPALVGEVNNTTNGDSSKLIVDKAISFMQDAVNDNEPFFTVIWFATPHTPVIHADENNPATPGSAKQRALKLNIEDMDTAMGALNAALETMGVKNNTMLWFTSDNGPENTGNGSVEWFDETSSGRSMRSGRFRARKRSLYEGGIRVPGILQWPAKIASGRTTDHIAVTSDYYSTIIDYLCLTVPGQKPLDGISLRPVIENTVTTRKQPLGFYARGMRSWMKQPYKIVASGAGGDDSMVVPTTNDTKWELYDIDAPSSNSDVEDTGHSSYLGKASLNEVNDPGNTLPQATKDIFIEMITEYQAWEATLQQDTPYVHSSQPTVTLSSPSNNVTMPSSFTVTATFNEVVTQLAVNEFVVTNGVASGLSGSGTTWSVIITPNSAGSVTVNLPAGAAIDSDGSLNAASNQLSVENIDPSAPSISLTTGENTVNIPFLVTATFSEDVTGVDLGDFTVTNGSASNLAGGPDVYTVTVTPFAPGNVTVQIPSDAVQDIDSNENSLSNLLSVTYVIPDGDSGISAGIVATDSLALNLNQTVDINELVPASGGNNVEKFTAGTINDNVANPYSTALYVRSGSGDGNARKVRAFSSFDLSSYANRVVSSATLTFNAHSLNNQNGVDVEVIALAADWAVSGSPVPTFNHGTVGSAVNGGAIHTNLDASHTKDYSFDVTPIVQNWVDGAWPNYGMQIRLTSTSASNGLGIKTSGSGAIQLEVTSVPMRILATGLETNGQDVSVEWNSLPGAVYRLEYSENLEPPWIPVASVRGATSSGSTVITHLGGLSGRERIFYRVVYLGNN